MLKILSRISDIIDMIINILIVIFFSILIFSCVLQVYTRFVLNRAFTWTEELARYTFIWANLLGAVLCTKKGSHATVTALSDRYSPSLKRKVTIFIQIIITLVALVMIRYGFRVTYLTRNQTSAAMRISMALINASVPICGLFIFIHSFAHLLKALIIKNDLKRGDI